jgi:hypothetical protein
MGVESQLSASANAITAARNLSQDFSLMVIGRRLS